MIKETFFPFEIVCMFFSNSNIPSKIFYFSLGSEILCLARSTSDRVTFIMIVNSFVPNVPFLYPLKTSENLMVFWCFQGVEKQCIGGKWVNKLLGRLSEEKSQRRDIIILLNKIFSRKLEVFSENLQR